MLGVAGVNQVHRTLQVQRTFDFTARMGCWGWESWFGERYGDCSPTGMIKSQQQEHEARLRRLEIVSAKRVWGRV